MAVVEISDHKYWWSGKTLTVLSKYISKAGSFFRKIFDKSRLKVGKIKKLEFQKLYVGQSGNHKHSFFITWIFYHLTDFCLTYAIQLNQISDICEVWKN